MSTGMTSGKTSQTRAMLMKIAQKPSRPEATTPVRAVMMLMTRAALGRGRSGTGVGGIIDLLHAGGGISW